MTSTISYCASSGSSIKDKLKGIVVSQGGFSQIVHPGHLVLIKPNFVAPFAHAVTIISKKESMANKLLKLSYQLLYLSDISYSRSLEDKSLIPKIHFYFWIRPKLDRRRCTSCGEGVSMCPVDVIRMPEKRIEPSFCMKMRCLECVQACLESAISIQGHRVSEAFDNSEDRISTGTGP